MSIEHKFTGHLLRVCTGITEAALKVPTRVGGYVANVNSTSSINRIYIYATSHCNCGCDNSGATQLSRSSQRHITEDAPWPETRDITILPSQS